MQLFKSLFSEERPKIMDKMANFLKEHNHNCVKIIRTKNHDFLWCQKNDCSKLKSNYDCPKIMNYLIDFLKQNGHECGTINGTQNHKFIWCQKDNCTKS